MPFGISLCIKDNDQRKVVKEDPSAHNFAAITPLPAPESEDGMINATLWHETKCKEM